MNDPSAEFEIETLDALPNTLDVLRGVLTMLIANGPLRISVSPLRDKRSNSANNLYWKWLTVMAQHFSRNGQSFTKDDMHDLMRHRFLGYEAKTIGKTEIQPQLKSTAELDTAQMCEYMTKIDAWCADHGCLLPRPEDNDYAEWQRAAA